jgi:hypothetical protein
MNMRCAALLFFIASTSLLRAQQPFFESLPASQTGIAFKNALQEGPGANVLTYEYFYNGGGVAIGDINNDGLEDIYLTSNMKTNALYLNQGNFKFKDITSSAKVACKGGWKTGVTMADVNGDGYLDLYVCYSGKGESDKRRNKLFINNGDLTFTDKAAEMGVNDPGYSTHATFFDFDRDGDLDLYVLNHNVTVIREVEYSAAHEKRDPYAGDKLYRNDNSRFTDISIQAGIKGNPLGFGLGVTAADINQDGWTDLYVSNDYVEPDYVYINNRDGTFTDRLTDYMQHISFFSMGCDVSDINNDARPDIFTVDMLPEDNQRQKLLYGPDNYEHYALLVMNGFYFQNMRNMLHLNNGDGTYSEIGQLAGVSNTDWSWAPLFADYDNDGWKDLFVTNGYYRDYTNRDFLKYKGDYYFQKAKAQQKADTFHLVTSMTSTPVHDYMYRNNGNLTFTDKSTDWGFQEPNFSNGASYGDLDNDGDLDLVVNNENAVASVFRNLLREKEPNRNYLQISLAGSGKNLRAIGAKIRVYAQGRTCYYEQIPARGFQSAVSDRIHVGLDKSNIADSIKITWPSGQETVVKNIKANQHLKIVEADGATTPHRQATAPSPAFVKTDPLIKYQHTEDGFNDFKRQPLLTTMLTNCGPAMASADVDRDGLIDIYVGGAQNSPGRLFYQTPQGGFEEGRSFPGQEKYTDAAQLFFDADGDGDQDLYVASGGYNEYKENDKALQDRLFLNDGSGRFASAPDALPVMTVSKSCIAANDFDQDGDIDLFIGGRVIPGNYPMPPESFLLRNNGGRFEKITPPALAHIGMVTDAHWMDIDSDKQKDLVIAGEFMRLEIFLNKKGELRQATDQYFDTPLTGLWTRILAQDFDHDGDEDLIIGNLGLNTQLHASAQEPLNLIYKDFDKNGSIDPILTYYVLGKPYPFASRDELLDQMYSLRSKFTSYAAYANAQLNDIFSPADLQDAGTLQATTLESIYLENKGGKLIPHALPVQAQYAPLYALATIDYNHDGHMDLIVAGNQSAIRIRVGVIDANFGQLFQGDGNGNFAYVPQTESGLSITGDTKSLQPLTVKGEVYLLAGINNVGISTYKLIRK